MTTMERERVTASTWETYALCAQVNPDTGARYDPRLWDVPDADDPNRRQRRQLNQIGRELCRTACPVLSWCGSATARLVKARLVGAGTIRAGANQHDHLPPKKHTRQPSTPRREAPS